MDKKTEQIAIRITPQTKKALCSVARERELSVAYTANRFIESAMSSERWAGGHGTNDESGANNKEA